MGADQDGIASAPDPGKLSHRNRALLRAVAAGHGEVIDDCEPVLIIDPAAAVISSRPGASPRQASSNNPAAPNHAPHALPRPDTSWCCGSAGNGPDRLVG